jgi:hypothetical protein
LGRRVVGGHRGDGGIRLAAAFDRTRRLRRLGRQGRQRPAHRQWNAYLREVAERAEAEILAGEVVGLEVDGEQWRLTVEPAETISADGVVLTGSGPPIAVPGQP